MQEPCAVCYVTFEKFLSNEAFSISGKLLRDMILDAVQGVLQPYILVLNDYSALVVFSQKELDAGQMKVDQLVKKLYNRFTMYQSFAPDMPYQENLPDYEEARNIYQTFTINEGHYTDDIAKTHRIYRRKLHAPAHIVLHFRKCQLKFQLSVPCF